MYKFSASILLFLTYFIYCIRCVVYVYPVAWFRSIIRKERFRELLIIHSKSALEESTAQISGSEPCFIVKHLPLDVPSSQASNLPVENALDFFGFELSSDRNERAMGISNEKYEGPLYSRHIFTVLCGMLRKSYSAEEMGYERQWLKSTHDGCRFGVDWYYSPLVTRHSKQTVCELDGEKEFLPPPQGLIVVLPGMSSSSLTTYVQHFALVAAAEHFHVVIINNRGMGDCLLDRPRYGDATFTADLKTFMAECLTPAALEERFGLFPQTVNPHSDGDGKSIAQEQYSVLPFFLTGFSFGATLCATLLCEVSDETEAHAAACICCPWDFFSSTKNLDRGLSGALYSYGLLEGLVAYVKSNAVVFAQSASPIVRNFVRSVESGWKPRTLYEFDTFFTAPGGGFNSADDYYTKGISFNKLHRVRVPLLCFSTEDDPVVGKPPDICYWKALCAVNPNILYVNSPVGGHIGFLSSPLDEIRGKANYVERRVLKAFKSSLSRPHRHARKYELPQLPPLPVEVTTLKEICARMRRSRPQGLDYYYSSPNNKVLIIREPSSLGVGHNFDVERYSRIEMDKKRRLRFLVSQEIRSEVSEKITVVST